MLKLAVFPYAESALQGAVWIPAGTSISTWLKVSDEQYKVPVKP